MAREKVMISSSVCRSENFLELSAEAQALYFQCCLEADRYGVVYGVKSLIRLCASSLDALNELLEASFLIELEGENGAFIVVRHWFEANKLDRTKLMSYRNDSFFNQVCIVDDSRAYRLISSLDLEAFEKASSDDERNIPNLNLYVTKGCHPSDTKVSVIKKKKREEKTTERKTTENEQTEPNEKEVKAASVTKCPRCGSDAAFYQNGSVITYDCQNCGIFDDQ